MQIPLEIVCCDAPCSDALEAFVRDRLERLERSCGLLLSCHVTLSRRNVPGGWQVKIAAHLRDRHEIIVVKDACFAAETQRNLCTLVHRAFHTLRGRIRSRLEEARELAGTASGG